MKHTPDSLQRRKVRSTVDWSCCGQTLIAFLVSRFPYRDEPGWRAVIAAGEITVNDAPAEPERRLEMHDVISYHPAELPEPPADMNWSAVWEDEQLLVIDKPGNLCVHPAGPFFKHTLWHLLCSKYGDIHFVNRLDRETSGLMIAARDKTAAARFGARSLIEKKVYTVMVHGRFDGPLHAAGFLSKDCSSVIRKKRRFTREAPEGPCESAETFFEPLGRSGDFSLLRATLGTGRMHQIRATLSSLGYPVVGDKLYGLDENFYLRQKTDELTAEDRKKLILPRQALHASEIVFRHPATGEPMRFTSPAPFGLPPAATAVTGAEGFIGSFMIRELEARKIPYMTIGRALWDDEALLKKTLSGAERVIHFAGLSRHADGDFLYRTNMLLAEKLARALKGRKTRLFFASSPHVIDHDLPYHKSKRDAMALFAREGIDATALLMPNTFGPGSKPFYNSVVSTFACLAARGEKPERVGDVMLRLIPVRELCGRIADLLASPDTASAEIAHTLELPLPELWARLRKDVPEDDLDRLLLEMKPFFRSLSTSKDRR
ncbi:MAG: NAD-dependent epimerase/dehydratase family protein [Lentisphaeria bacterium]|nr:NAD-dependent epimerase/dehydratase family protein [Lentisphaeria bacterium]